MSFLFDRYTEMAMRQAELERLSPPEIDDELNDLLECLDELRELQFKLEMEIEDINAELDYLREEHEIASDNDLFALAESLLQKKRELEEQLEACFEEIEWIEMEIEDNHTWYTRRKR
jgi:phage shock protein A